MGDVDLNGVVSILDALEILMYLAGLDSVINDNPKSHAHGRITGEANPTINDALEILMFLAGMDSKITWIPPAATE
jgi:hypothetical protein